MKISMWLVCDWLEKYSPKASIYKGEMTISGVRFLSEEVTPTEDCLYIGYAQAFTYTAKNNIICVSHTDIITLTAPDIYVVFNEIQQMLEFYNNWETQVLLSINREEDLSTILSHTLPILNHGLVITDLSHKVLGLQLLPNQPDRSAPDGYIETHELSLINAQLQKNADRHIPYVIDAAAAKDIIRNFYSNDGKLLGWLVIVDGGEKQSHLQSRLQLTEAFGMLMDLWFRIHADHILSANLFSNVLEMRETDPAVIQFRLHGLGWVDHSQMQLFVCASCTNDIIGISTISRIIKNYYPEIYDFSYENTFAFIVNYCLTDKDRFLSYLTDLLKAQNAFCGCSLLFSDLFSLKQNYLQACSAIEFGPHTAGSINDSHEYALVYIQKQLKTSLEIDMISPIIGKLRAYDEAHGTDYYETLKIYIKCERDQTRTARELFIHRNSLVYRINRLKEMLGFDLDNDKERLYLILSFFIADTYLKDSYR